jgi:hypothetical protein
MRYAIGTLMLAALAVTACPPFDDLRVDAGAGNCQPVGAFCTSESECCTNTCLGGYCCQSCKTDSDCSGSTPNCHLLAKCCVPTGL